MNKDINEVLHILNMCVYNFIDTKFFIIFLKYHIKLFGFWIESNPYK